METAATITPPDAHGPTDELTARKRRNAVEKLQICREAIASVDTAEKESWSRIMLELADGGFTDAELEADLAASRNTLYKWKTGGTAPRQMTRRLLQKAILEMVDERLHTLEG